MAGPPEVLVRGHAEVRATPDRALLRVGVQADGDQREQVFAAAARAASAIDSVLDSHAGAIERRNTAGVMLRPRLRWDGGESVRTGWIASRTTLVGVSDLTAIGPLVTELSAAGATEIQGPWWEVVPSNPAHDAARREAARDARRRAETYAEAQGLRLGALRWLAEPGLRATRAFGAQPVAASAQVLRQRAPGPDSMPVDAEEISVDCSVEACFRLEAGA